MIDLKLKNNSFVGRRHPWVFSGAFLSIPEGLQSGDLVRVLDRDGSFFASGYFNSYSQIAVRIWSYRDGERVNQAFFVKRLANALAIRERFVEPSGTNAYRLINSESDFLPGLIVDRYGKYLSVQFHTRGIEIYKEQVIAALREVCRPIGIYERSESNHRKRDDLEKSSGLLFGEVPDEVEITENNFKFLVDIKEGQKTGFFLDQRDKRQAISKYSKNASVVNLFSYSGGFSVYALAGGARRVVSVDVSEKALELAKKNVILNGFDLDKCEFIKVDVKEYLKKINNNEFDIVILDPPAFIKDRHKKREGVRGYAKINEAAASITDNGILITCSCSTHLNLQDFRYMAAEAVAAAGKNGQILETFIHGIDHLEALSFIESEYLKCLVLKISN